MNELHFSTPTLAQKDEILRFRREFLAIHQRLHGGNELNAFTDDGFVGWLNYVAAPAGARWFEYEKVNDSTHLAWIGERVVGIMHLRHELNEALLATGGHVGYSVHPDFQGQGIATQMLRHALEQLKALGLTKVLVTCADINPASRAVIVKNGGVLENVVPSNTDSYKNIERYWIDL